MHIKVALELFFFVLKEPVFLPVEFEDTSTPYRPFSNRNFHVVRPPALPAVARPTNRLSVGDLLLSVVVGFRGQQ